MYSFSANLSIQNAAGLHLAHAEQQRSVRKDPTTLYQVDIELELRAGNSGNTPLALYGEYMVSVRNGPSDLIRLRTVSEWSPRAPISERLIVVRGGVVTPTGMDTFLLALGAGNTNAQLNAALTALKNLGVIEQASLPGSAP